MLLVDTNVWLEGLLEQEQADQVRRFLGSVPPELIFITDFSIHSIGIITITRGMAGLFEKFIADVVKGPSIHKVRLENGDLDLILKVCRSQHLDFDDAYQYVAAEKFGLTLVSFDADFDRTPRGRKTPKEIITNG